MKKFACLMVLLLVGTLMVGGCKKKEPAAKVDAKSLNEAAQKTGDAAAGTAKDASDAAKSTADSMKKLWQKEGK